MCDKERKIVFWSCEPEAETFSCETIGEAIEEFIEEQHCFGEELPEEVEVHGFARMQLKVNEFSGRNVLDDLLERMDEEYMTGDYGDPTTSNEEMREAEKVFIQAIIDEYVPWACEEVTSGKINIKEHLALCDHLSKVKIVGDGDK